MRRKSSVGSDHKVEALDEAKIEEEITLIDRLYDFDVPSAIDWDLLIVSVSNSFNL